MRYGLIEEIKDLHTNEFYVTHEEFVNEDRHIYYIHDIEKILKDKKTSLENENYTIFDITHGYQDVLVYKNGKYVDEPEKYFSGFTAKKNRCIRRFRLKEYSDKELILMKSILYLDPVDAILTYLFVKISKYDSEKFTEIINNSKAKRLLFQHIHSILKEEHEMADASGDSYSSDFVRDVMYNYGEISSYKLIRCVNLSAKSYLIHELYTLINHT